MKIQHFIQSSVTPSIARKLKAALLCVALLPACPWDGPRAQSDTGVSQTQVRTTSLDQPRQVQEGSHELSSFFLIGIMINIVALVLFVMWAVREWKKKKPADRAEDQ